jgi:hypothetical protein
MAMETYENKFECEVIFNTDSKPVGIDNHAQLTYQVILMTLTVN